MAEGHRKAQDNPGVYHIPHSFLVQEQSISILFKDDELENYNPIDSTLVDNILGLDLSEPQIGAVEGRSIFHMSNWILITKDPWILDTVTGCHEFQN